MATRYFVTIVPGEGTSLWLWQQGTLLQLYRARALHYGCGNNVLCYNCTLRGTKQNEITNFVELLLGPTDLVLLIVTFSY